MRRSPTRSILITTTAAALLLSGSAAFAGVGQVVDPVADAPAEGDLTLVTVDNGVDLLQVKAKVARLTVGRTHLVATLTPVTATDPATDPVDEPETDPVEDPTDPAAEPVDAPETDPIDAPEVDAPAAYVVRSVVLPATSKGKGKPAKPGKIGAVLESVDAAGEVTAVVCKNVKATLAKGRNGQSQLRVPQVCLGGLAGTMSVVVTTVDADGEVVDEADPVEVTLD
ncbi:hypothetical protein [Nocardioides ferulae]|uniref:hypothetical protein n=1 Tax=Nocardioides ferulae TaxID=2340821 RepID=UPI000EB16B8A|nr:hypothetical protein [Nocardioides ferulae]